MNEIVSRMINTQLLLFLYMLCGVIVAKIGIIRDNNRQVVVRLLMDVAMPMMVTNANERSAGCFATIRQPMPANIISAEMTTLCL